MRQVLVIDNLSTWREFQWFCVLHHCSWKEIMKGIFVSSKTFSIFRLVRTHTLASVSTVCWFYFNCSTFPSGCPSVFAHHCKDPVRDRSQQAQFAANVVLLACSSQSKYSKCRVQANFSKIHIFWFVFFILTCFCHYLYKKITLYSKIFSPFFSFLPVQVHIKVKWSTDERVLFYVLFFMIY